MRGSRCRPTAAPPEKTIVEHTAINPNKAAHIGHLRNAALGDTLVRVLRFRGTPVEVQNYIDDTGVQVADVIVGFRELEQRDARRGAADRRHDALRLLLLGSVLARHRVVRRRQARASTIRAAALHDLEHGGNDTAAMGAFIVDRIVRAHLQTMARLNIGYDLLTYEGDILRLQFWARAFEILKAQGAVFLQTEGKLAGCWVMRIEERQAPTPSEQPTTASADERSAREGDRPLERRRHLRRQGHREPVLEVRAARPRLPLPPLRDAGQRPAAVVDDVRRRATPARRRSAAPTRIYNVIDSRQMYLQALLSQALRTLGHPDGSRELDPLLVRDGGAVARDRARARLRTADDERGREEAVRRGVGPQRARREDRRPARPADRQGHAPKSRSAIPSSPPRSAGASAAQIAVAAIRYFMLKFSRGKLIVFDIEEALSFEGETGPYLQYAVVRAEQHLPQAAGARRARPKPTSSTALDGTPADETAAEPTTTTHDLWALVFEASRLDDVVEQVVRSLEFSVLAKYAFGLAQMFNAFYHRYPILNEERRRSEALARRRRRLRPRAADARARPDGHRSPASDVARWHAHWLISVTRAGSSRTTGRRSCTSAASRGSSTRRWRSTRRSTGIDGLLLTGGDDVAPARYGEAPHRAVGRGRAGRDEFEIALVDAARARKLPIFAICRGIQVLNVACGGTLVQDIPSQVTGALEHSLHGAAAPAVLARARSLGREGLAAVAADARAAERRRHVRGEQPPPPGGEGRRARLPRRRRPRPTASSRRSRIPAPRFCLGVQWHPENFWRTGEFRPLFEGFLEAASRSR